MHLGISCAAATLLVAIAVQSATADDFSVCAQATGDEAIAACTRMLALNATDAVAYNNRGKAYVVVKGDYDRAIADFTEAIRLDPKLALPYLNRGGSYIYKHDYDRAISDLDHAIGLDPKNAVAFSNRAGAYANKGDYDRAIADGTEAIRLDPKLAWAYSNRARPTESRTIMTGRSPTTMRRSGSIRNLLWSTTTAPSLTPGKGDLDRTVANYDQAITDFDQGLKLNPSLVIARQDRDRVQAFLAKRSSPGAQTNAPAR